MPIDTDQIKRQLDECSLADELVIRVEHPEEEDCYADVKPSKVEIENHKIVVYIVSPI